MITTQALHSVSVVTASVCPMCGQALPIAPLVAGQAAPTGPARGESFYVLVRVSGEALRLLDPDHIGGYQVKSGGKSQRTQPVPVVRVTP